MYKIIFFLLSFSIFAENLTLNLISDFPQDTKNFYGEISKFEKKEYLIGGSLLTTAFLLTTVDSSIKNFKDSHESETLDTLTPIFRKFGEFYPQLLFFTYGQMANDTKAIKTSIYSLEAALLGSSITYLGKNIFARARPNTGEGSSSWFNKSFNSAYSSFPSGHSTVAFATATVISQMYKDEKFIPPLMYTLASLAAFSRVYNDKHWASDIFLGSAIGYYSGKLLLKLKNKEDNFLFPQSNGTEFGITFGGEF